MEFLEKCGILQIPVDACLQPIERGYQRFRHIAAAVGTEAPARIGELARQRIGEQAVFVDWHGSDHEISSCAEALAAATKAAIFAMDLIPGRCSTPLETSTP